MRGGTKTGACSLVIAQRPFAVSGKQTSGDSRSENGTSLMSYEIRVSMTVPTNDATKSMLCIASR
jgi:hypothetical protein